MKTELRKFENVSSRTRRTMKKIRGKDTSIEVKLRKALWSKGYRYRKNYKKLPGCPDIVLPKYKIAIFCDSEFFHGKDWEKLEKRLRNGNNPQYWITRIRENIQRDQRNDRELRLLGWTVLHFWGSDINKNLDDCVQTIEETAFSEKITSDTLRK